MGIERKDLGLLLIRLIFFMWMLHGISKLLDIGGTASFFQHIGIPLPGVMAVVVGLVETLGSFAMLLGIGTSLAGPLLALVMLVAIITTKLGSIFKGLPFSLNSMDLEFANFIAAAGIALIGPGAYSLEALLMKKKDMPKK